MSRTLVRWLLRAYPYAWRERSMSTYSATDAQSPGIQIALALAAIAPVYILGL